MKQIMKLVYHNIKNLISYHYVYHDIKLFQDTRCIILRITITVKY